MAMFPEKNNNDSDGKNNDCKSEAKSNALRTSNQLQATNVRKKV